LSAKTQGSDAEIAREILNYFLRNPEAADSLTGIARWRLMEEVARRSVEGTESAVNWLIAQGYLVEVGMGTERIFKLNPQKLEDARGSLKTKNGFHQ